MATLQEKTGVRIEKFRLSSRPVEPIFLERWSPRAFAVERLTEDEVLTLLEAGRWAPSSYNGQPWRFLYAMNGTAEWDSFFSLLVEFNQSWTRRASALIVFLSRRTFERNGRPSRTHSFDAGSAWMSIALQAAMKGWIAHGMEGFDYDRARQELKVPGEYDIEAMAAVGKPGSRDDLPEEISGREYPSGRKSLEEIAFCGGFPASP